MFSYPAAEDDKHAKSNAAEFKQNQIAVGVVAFVVLVLLFWTWPSSKPPTPVAVLALEPPHQMGWNVCESGWRAVEGTLPKSTGLDVFTLQKQDERDNPKLYQQQHHMPEFLCQSISVLKLDQYTCGVVGSEFGLHRNLIVLREPLTYMVNAVINHGKDQRLVDESQWMCEGGHEQRNRSLTIEVSYWDALDQTDVYRRELKDEAAVCVQHLLDVVKGIVPGCGNRPRRLRCAKPKCRLFGAESRIPSRAEVELVFQKTLSKNEL
jgi:peptide deformylase